MDSFYNELSRMVWQRAAEQSLRACENSVQIGMSGGKVPRLARRVVLNIDEDDLLGESNLWRQRQQEYGVGFKSLLQSTF